MADVILGWAMAVFPVALLLFIAWGMKVTMEGSGRRNDEHDHDDG